MKKDTRRALSLSLVILGLLVIFLKPITGITGFAVANEAASFFSGFWLWFIGISLIVAGAVLTDKERLEKILESTRRYQQADTELRKRLGKRYYDIRPEERTAYVKSYRRHLENSGEEVEIDTGQTTTGGYRIIRTGRFERAVKKHDPDTIQNAIDKIGTGLGKEEPLTGRDDWSIRTSKGGRIIFEKDDSTKTVRLRSFTASHKYDRN